MARLQEANLDGAFLLRMSATQSGVYTISLQSKGEIKHIRVTNTKSGFSLGKSKTEYPSIWDLIEAQLDQQLKSTKGDAEVQLIYPLEAKSEAIAPDLLARAAEAGMNAEMFDADVMAFMTGGVSTEELARRRKEQQDKSGVAGYK